LQRYEVFAEHNPHGVQVGQSVYQVTERPAEAIDLPDGHQVEFALVGIEHEPVQRRPGLLSPGDTVVDVLLDHCPFSPSRILPQFGQLHLRVLVAG
jgi:hypothetical protein